jgi:cation:H+ antiporter
MMILSITLLLSLVAIWIASGFMVSHTRHLSSYLKFPSFSFSLLLLGTLTSIPEFLVAFNATVLNQPDISLGNLIGGQAILILCIIPLLALRKNGLRFRYPLQSRTIALTMITIALPFLALLNQQVSVWEAAGMMVSFLLFILVFATDLRREHLLLALKKKQKRSAQISLKVSRSLAVIAVAIAVIFLASNRLVTSVSAIALLLGLDSFFVSLFVTAIGTNIPEITLALRALLAHKSEIALGDYFGSAALNTFIFALVTFAVSGVHLTAPTLSLGIPLIGFGLFWWFARSKRTLSYMEAIGLLSVFLLFLALFIRAETG